MNPVNHLERNSVINLLSEVYSFIFLEAQLHQRPNEVDMLGFNVFLHVSSINFNIAGTKVWPISMIQ